MLGAPDRAIWEEATRREAVLVSKDEDFVHMGLLRAAGPSVVWVRVGDATRREILETFERLMPEVEAALKAGERVVEVAARGPAA